AGAAGRDADDDLSRTIGIIGGGVLLGERRRHRKQRGRGGNQRGISRHSRLLARADADLAGEMMVFSLANVAYRAGCGKCGAWYQRGSLDATNALAFCEPGALASAVGLALANPPSALAERMIAEGRMKRALVLGLAFACGLASVQTARAETSADDYPQHTVTFLCPFPAGGGTDILTR